MLDFLEMFGFSGASTTTGSSAIGQQLVHEGKRYVLVLQLDRFVGAFIGAECDDEGRIGAGARVCVLIHAETALHMARGEKLKKYANVLQAASWKSPKQEVKGKYHTTKEKTWDIATQADGHPEDCEARDYITFPYDKDLKDATVELPPLEDIICKEHLAMLDELVPGWREAL